MVLGTYLFIAESPQRPLIFDFGDLKLVIW